MSEEEFDYLVDDLEDYYREINAEKDKIRRFNRNRLSNYIYGDGEENSRFFKKEYDANYDLTKKRIKQLQSELKGDYEKYKIKLMLNGKDGLINEIEEALKPI